MSEFPKYNVNKYQSPASVATAIDDMAEVIVTKAAQEAKEAIAIENVDLSLACSMQQPLNQAAKCTRVKLRRARIGQESDPEYDKR